MILLELKEFVKEALTNIVDGVEMANKEHKRFQISGSYHSGKDVSGEYVEFDVSVTTQNKKEINAKGKFGILADKKPQFSKEEVEEEAFQKVTTAFGK
jgi:hypothetical protein